MTRHRSEQRRGATAVVAIVAAVAATAMVVVGTWFVSTSAVTPEPAAAEVNWSVDHGGSTAPAESSPTPFRELARPLRADPPRKVVPLAASEPDRLVVPALGLDVDVIDLGLTDAGSLEVPSGAFPAGWYTGSPTPGELGPAVIAGHVSFNGAPGVFENLSRLRAGDEIQVIRVDGTAAPFVVTRTAEYDKAAFPTADVYGDIAHAGLRLITCGGLDPDSGVFEQNLVVYAELEKNDPPSVTPDRRTPNAS